MYYQHFCTPFPLLIPVYQLTFEELMCFQPMFSVLLQTCFVISVTSIDVDEKNPIDVNKKTIYGQLKGYSFEVC